MNKAAFLAVILACDSGAAWAADTVTEPPMASIPAGAFAMGSSTTNAAPPYPVEQPVHEVRIAAFQLAEYEVTVGQFRQFIKATGHKTESTCWRYAANEWGMENAKASWDAPAYQQGEYHPVMCVTWTDARAYTAWLAAQTGKPYRLPSESEWEYAARAGSPDEYHFGADETPICRYGNIRDTLGREAIGKLTGKPGKEAACSDGAEFTSIVGMYEPNAFGLCDMIGNVGEIVEDCEHQSYEGAPQDGSAWTTNCSSDMKMHRGGSFGARSGGASTVRGHTFRNPALFAREQPA
jgi:formylglycine-generating enzyme required for sulfatase activity